MDNSVKMISAEQAGKWGREVLKCISISDEYANYIIDQLVFCNLRGIDTHGLIHLDEYVDRYLHSSSEPVRTIRDFRNMAVIDAGNNSGQVGASVAMNTAIEKAREYGCGLVWVKNSNHFGAASYYTSLAVRQNMLGFTATNAHKGMAPWGSTEILLGNNPYSVGMPGPGFPIILDMALSVVAKGKIRTCLREGLPLLPGWALDKDGNPTVDPQKGLEGSLMPIAGHKGCGMSVMIDLLCAVITRGCFAWDVGYIGSADEKMNSSHFLMAVDFSSIVSKEEYQEYIQAYYDRYKKASLKEGVGDVYLPGEIEWAVETKRKQEGIPYTAKVLERLNALADKVGAPKL